MAQEEKLFKAPEQKKAEEKPVEAQKEEAEAKEKQHEAVQQKAHELEKKVAEAADAKEAPKEAKKEEKEEEHKREIVTERVVTASLGESFKKPLNARGNYAVRLLREQIARGFKVEQEAVKISPAVSNLVFARSSRKPPRKIKLACSLDKEGVVVVEPA